jgi:hypothetical protein
VTCNGSGASRKRKGASLRRFGTSRKTVISRTLRRVRSPSQFGGASGTDARTSSRRGSTRRRSMVRATKTINRRALVHEEQIYCLMH